MIEDSNLSNRVKDLSRKSQLNGVLLCANFLKDNHQLEASNLLIAMALAVFPEEMKNTKEKVEQS